MIPLKGAASDVRPGAPVARLAACSCTYMGWVVLLGWAAFGDPMDRRALAGCGLLPWSRWQGRRPAIAFWSAPAEPH